MKHLKRDHLRLAATYLAIIMAMSIGFSIIFYTASVRELEHRPRGGGPAAAFDTSFQDYLNQREEDAREALLIDLYIANVTALLIGSVISYFLAQAALRPIEENMEAQTRFVSDASHELRTPLTALRTANEVALRNKSLKLPEAKRVIADNVDDIARLQNLASSMLGLLRDEDDAQFQLPVRLSEVVDDAMNMVVNEAIAKDIAVDSHIKGITVRGNHQRLVQLMTILLDNAIKYSHHGTTITLKSSIHNKSAIVTITDEGIGMDEKTVARLFTRFYRAEESRSTPGYGLGLAIAQKIIDSHHGKISVESHLGTGSTFTIKLPLI